jgi:hypothetical protein
MAYKFFRIPVGVVKAGVMMLFLILPVFLFAQVDSLPLADSIVPLVDTAPVAVDTPVSTEEVNDEEDESEDEEVINFIAKGAPGGGMDAPVFRKIGDSTVDALHADKDFWYANTVFAKNKAVANEETQRGRSIFESVVFQTLLWIVIIASFIGFLAMYLANSNVRLFRKNRTVDSVEDDNVELQDIFAISYQKEIDRAIGAGNLRLAVRLLFLQLLRQLSDKNLIQYKQDRTNFDYLLQVSQTNWYPQFFRLTRHYEYVWYGKFDIDTEQFDVIKKDFGSLGKQLIHA